MPSIKIIQANASAARKQASLSHCLNVSVTFPRTATAKTLPGEAIPMFLTALLYSKKLHSDHESILQIFNPGILALNIGQT